MHEVRLGEAMPSLAWRDYTESDLSPTLRAALDCFVEQGYHGTSVRKLAARAGLSVPGLYHHYPSKRLLLIELVERAMADLRERSEAALAEAGDSIGTQFDYLIECLTLYHAHRRGMAFIASSEIRSLRGEVRAKHIAARDHQQRLLDDLVIRGVSEGVFATPFPREASRAVVTMCTGVSQWYRQGGGLSAEGLAKIYVRLAQATVMAPSPGR